MHERNRGSDSWLCKVCGWIYDESVGNPEHSLTHWMRFVDIPAYGYCPEGGMTKLEFESREFRNGAPRNIDAPSWCPSPGGPRVKQACAQWNSNWHA